MAGRSKQDRPRHERGRDEPRTLAAPGESLDVGRSLGSTGRRASDLRAALDDGFKITPRGVAFLAGIFGLVYGVAGPGYRFVAAIDHVTDTVAQIAPVVSDHTRELNGFAEWKAAIDVKSANAEKVHAAVDAHLATNDARISDLERRVR